MSSDCGTGSRSVLEWRVPLRFLCTQEEELRRSPGLFLCSCGPGEGAQITPGKKPDKVASPTQAQTSPIAPCKNREPGKEGRRNSSGTIASSKVEPEPHRRAQSSAQSGKATKAGREYPAEEAGLKKANTEPTERQTDAAAETARRRIPQQNPPNLKAKLSASTRSTTSSFPATRILTRSNRASAGGSRTTPWRHSRWIRSKAQRVRSESGRTQTPLLRARIAARTRRSRKVEETDSRGSKAPETAHRAPRGSAKKNPTCAAFPSAKCKNPKI